MDRLSFQGEYPLGWAGNAGDYYIVQNVVSAEISANGSVVYLRAWNATTLEPIANATHYGESGTYKVITARERGGTEYLDPVGALNETRNFGLWKKAPFSTKK